MFPSELGIGDGELGIFSGTYPCLNPSHIFYDFYFFPIYLIFICFQSTFTLFSHQWFISVLNSRGLGLDI